MLRVAGERQSRPGDPHAQFSQLRNLLLGLRIYLHLHWPLEGVTNVGHCPPSYVLLCFSFGATIKMDPVLKYFSTECPSSY